MNLLEQTAENKNQYLSLKVIVGGRCTDMRKRQLTKRAVFAAICLTVIVIWQRQWLTDDNSTDTKDTVALSDTDSRPGLDRQDHSLVYRHTDIPTILRQNKPDLADEINLTFSWTTPSSAFIKTGEKEIRPEETKDLQELQKHTFQNASGNVNKSSRNPVNRNVHRAANNSDMEFYNDTGDIEKLFQENLAETPKPNKFSTDHITRTPSTTKSVPKTFPEDEVPNKIKEDISNEDDDELAGFIAQQNFRRREEFTKNASAYLQNEVKRLESNKKPEIESKLHDSAQLAENVLSNIKGIVIKDDRSDFFGQMPKFVDYDLPIHNSSVLPADQAPQQQEKTPKFPSQNPSPQTEEESLPDENEDDSQDENIDPTMEGVLILGKVNNTRKYAVFSTTTENRESLTFIFYVPLTVLAWKRVGFDSVVIIVGSKDDWDSDPLLNHVLSTAQRLDCVVIFLEPRPEKSIMISQVARIFAANILRSAFNGIDDVYMVTSDTDLWPIYGDVYNLPPGKRILSLNSDCCTPFNHRRTQYKMLPMANVGMTVRSWRQITRKFGDSPKTIDDILTYFVQEFGTVALRPVHKGDNIGWYLDQMMISILISNWIKDHGAKTVKFVPRDVGVDRIDRAGWSFGQNSIEDKVDAHLLFEAYIPGVWVRVLHLLRTMYGDMTERYLWCVNYYETFQRLFLEKYRSNRQM